MELRQTPDLPKVNIKVPFKRTNGFMCPLHPQQVIVGVYCILQVVSVFGIMLTQKYVLLPGVIVFLTTYLILFLIVGQLAYKCTVCDPSVYDPTDIIVTKQQNFKQQKKDFFPEENDNYGIDGKPLHLWCQVCDAYVNESSKHCGVCNRCCLDFDHHCNWLNNCIGIDNYSNFYKLIILFLVFLGIFIIIAVLALVEKTIYQRQWMLIIVCIQIGMNVIAIGFDAQLVNLHRWLQARDIRTFDLVIFQRKKVDKQHDLSNGYIDKKEFNKWCDDYFTVKQKRTSKIIVEKQKQIEIDQDEQQTPNKQDTLSDNENNEASPELKSHRIKPGIRTDQFDIELVSPGIQEEFKCDAESQVSEQEDFNYSKVQAQPLKSKGCCQTILCHACIGPKQKADHLKIKESSKDIRKKNYNSVHDQNRSQNVTFSDLKDANFDKKAAQTVEIIHDGRFKIEEEDEEYDNEKKVQIFLSDKAKLKQVHSDNLISNEQVLENFKMLENRQMNYKPSSPPKKQSLPDINKSRKVEHIVGLDLE